MKVAFHTLGCKVNQYETEAMREQFEKAGHTVVGETDPADAYIINTCTVTSLADRKSRQYIRRMKKISPDSIVAVTGCYVQIKPDEVAAIDGVDIIAGTNEKENILSYIQEFILIRNGSESNVYNNEKEATDIASEASEHSFRHVLPYDELGEYKGSGIITSMESRTRAYIKIEDGCDRFCSYCVIPYARGPVRSRPQDEIIAEAESLVRQGFKELILTGINTALYEDLPGLLRRLDELEEHNRKLDFRVRLSSLEPTVVNAEYVKGLLGFRRLCHHLHLSIQSGSDNVLTAMRRRYDMNEYMQIVEVLREFDPLFGLSTDMIAGFPGETEDDIACSVDTIKRVEFCKTHAFNYSQRPGTVAASMTGQVPPPERKKRVAMLIQAGEEAARKFAEKNIGTITKVLFEERIVEENEIEKRLMTGYTDNYIRAYAAFNEDLLGQLVEVKIVSLYKDGVFVEIC